MGCSLAGVAARNSCQLSVFSFQYNTGKICEICGDCEMSLRANDVVVVVVGQGLGDKSIAAIQDWGAAAILAE